MITTDWTVWDKRYNCSAVLIVIKRIYIVYIKICVTVNCVWWNVFSLRLDITSWIEKNFDLRVRSFMSEWQIEKTNIKYYGLGFSKLDLLVLKKVDIEIYQNTCPRKNHWSLFYRKELARSHVENRFMVGTCFKSIVIRTTLTSLPSTVLNTSN